MMADKTISYDIAQELKSYFEFKLTDSLVTYNITMRTIEVNDNSAIIFIMQTGLTYSAIILFVTCFTILALQQLSDSGKYKYRFRVLRNMGVEEPSYTKVDFETISCMVWCSGYTGLILAGAFLVIFDCRIPYADCSVYRSTAIGAAAFDCVGYFRCLLISYFISTWVLFNKSASA